MDCCGKILLTLYIEHILLYELEQTNILKFICCCREPTDSFYRGAEFINNFSTYYVVHIL